MSILVVDANLPPPAPRGRGHNRHQGGRPAHRAPMPCRALRHKEATVFSQNSKLQNHTKEKQY